MKTLIENHANPLVVNSEGKTSSQLAKNDAVKSLLQGILQTDKKN